MNTAYRQGQHTVAGWVGTEKTWAPSPETDSCASQPSPRFCPEVQSPAAASPMESSCVALLLPGHTSGGRKNATTCVRRGKEQRCEASRVRCSRTAGQGPPACACMHARRLPAGQGPSFAVASCSRREAARGRQGRRWVEPCTSCCSNQANVGGLTSIALNARQQRSSFVSPSCNHHKRWALAAAGGGAAAANFPDSLLLAFLKSRN